MSIQTKPWKWVWAAEEKLYSVVSKSVARRRGKIKRIVKIRQGHCIRLTHYKELGKKPPCDPWPELTKVSPIPLTAKLLTEAILVPCPCTATSPRTGAHTHTTIQGIQIETDETASSTVLHWRQATLSQNCMKISKAPEITKLVISSTQVCLTLIYCCMSWTTKALLRCQTWKPYITESQSFNKIILWEAEGLWNNSSLRSSQQVQKKNHLMGKLDF